MEQSTITIRPTKEERERYNVNYLHDSDFSAYARLLQSKWREEKLQLPFNKYGNFLPADIARETKGNFLTEKIRTLVQYELYRKSHTHKLIKEDRMWENLLSSQPLCFNLFGELHFDNKLATKFFKILFPKRVEIVTDILFEYSPGRGNLKYTGDRSAFDVFVTYTNKGKRGFIGIEVKYAESLTEEDDDTARKNFKEIYVTLTNGCNHFKINCIDNLKQPPLSQIWRDHLLSIATKQDYDEGFFVFLFPLQNVQCQSGVDNYKQNLSSDNEELCGFYPRYLDDFIRTLRQLHRYDNGWTKGLAERYLGNDHVLAQE